MKLTTGVNLTQISLSLMLQMLVLCLWQNFSGKSNICVEGQACQSGALFGASSTFG
jgi:hypothetical protein